MDRLGGRRLRRQATEAPSLYLLPYTIHLYLMGLSLSLSLFLSLSLVPPLLLLSSSASLRSKIVAEGSRSSYECPN